MQTIRNTIMAGAAALSLGLLAPMGGASAHSFHLSFDDHEDLLEQLIELDADGIDDLRDELVEARAEIGEAIYEIQEAKEEVKGVPFGGMIARIAFPRRAPLFPKQVKRRLTKCATKWPRPNANSITAAQSLARRNMRKRKALSLCSTKKWPNLKQRSKNCRSR